MALDRFPAALQSCRGVALLEISVLPAESPDPDQRPVRVAVAGEIDPLTVGSLHAALTGTLRRHRPDRIELDLSAVTFLDSTGIRTLLTGLVTAQRAGCTLTVTEASPRVHEMLRITGLLEVFGLADRDRPGAALRPSAGAR